ncbi:MAG: arginine N-succinyltransferase [Phycisphaeraceae bacterium]|nr:arginine N-succinyltransferase [Phycisphaeraceae bacterium]
MFLMRRAKIEDVLTLLKLAKMVHFINLPADKDIIADKAVWSRKCFEKAAKIQHGDAVHNDVIVKAPGRKHSAAAEGGLASMITRSDLFMFVLEDTESGGVLGTSQIISRMGGPGQPNVSFELSRKEMFSRSLQVGATHTVAKLFLDESGPTEIGGLILQPSYRGHKAKLGRFLSLVRFHFVGLYPELFSDRIIAEMMGPLTPDGRNTLWEYLGRRFINLSYPEADNFCQYSKEFMTSLLPKEEIYLTLLPPEARSVIAQVGPETLPARRMLEKLGFEYKNRIDPFDGGPTLEARTRGITLVKGTSRRELGEPASNEDLRSRGESAIVSMLDADGEFRCVNALVLMTKSNQVRLSQEAMELLFVEPGITVGITPLGEKSEPSRPARTGASAQGNGSHRSTAGAQTREGVATHPARKSTKK